jgi:two-component system, chemotaxis family, sensor kinase CheA
MSAYGGSAGSPSGQDASFPVAGRTALIVEDDLASALALKAVLERARMNVLHAADGRTALDALDGHGAEGIGIVLMDIKMPRMNGYQAMTAIRERAQFAQLPIIAVSAKDAGGERERCLQAGASDFIPKPIDVSDLMGAIDMWLEPALP